MKKAPLLVQSWWNASYIKWPRHFRGKGLSWKSHEKNA